MRGSFSALVAVLATSSLASAAPGKPQPGDKHQPPVALDPSTIAIELVSQGDSGYKPRLSFIMMGASSPTDRVRFDWKQGGKVLGTAACTGRYNAKRTSLSGKCMPDAPVTAKGRIEVDIVYSDDQTDTDYLVTTLEVDVRKWPSLGKTIEWGIVPDDVLALAFVKLAPDGTRRRVPIFQFWSSGSLTAKTTVFRCTVDGKKLPDFEANLGNYGIEGEDEIAHAWTREKDSRSYTFTHYGVEGGFHYGTRAELAAAYNKKESELNAGTHAAGEFPGKWDCGLRIEGKVVRRFLFTVDASGMIAPSELASGAWPGIKTFDDMVMVDMRIPEDNGYEKRIRKDALAKSVGFGIAWPAHPKAKEAQAAFPKSMGTPD